LPHELDRVRRLREDLDRRQARQRTVAEIDSLLEAGEFDRALDAARQALEFSAGASELEELEKQAQKALDRREQANDLVVNGRRELDAGRSAEGLALLRRAAELDPMGVRSALADTLALRGRDLMEQDPAGAETALREAMGLEPRHTLAVSLLNVLAQRSEHAEADRIGAEARQLQTEGRIREAMARAEEGLRRMPGDSGLRQLKETLAKRLSEESQRDSEAFRTILGNAAQIEAPGEMREQRRRLEAIIERHPDGEELREQARDFFTRVDEAERKNLPPEPRAPAAESNVRPLMTRLHDRPMLVSGLACLALSILFGGALYLPGLFVSSTPRPSRPVRMGHLLVLPEPAGKAEARLNGRAEPLGGSTELEPGAYELTVNAPGFETKKKTVHVILGQPTEERVVLRPLPYAVKIRGPVPSVIFHNGQQIRVGANQDWSPPAELAPGKHEFKIFLTPALTATVRFNVSENGATSAFQAESSGLRSIAVHRFGNDQTVCTFDKAATATGCQPGTAAPVRWQEKPVAAPGEHGATILFQYP
jgi:hypothetical protein